MTSPLSPHRAWIEVDHEAIRSNLRTIGELAVGAQVIGVVKANAYGHGDVDVARTLVAEGVERLAVATVDEAARLRAAGIRVPIVLLWGIGPAEADAVAQHELEPVVYDAPTVDILERAAQRFGVQIGVHLKLDSGLGRQGATASEILALAARITRIGALRLVGTMSHLAVPGEDAGYTDAQRMRLARVVDAMRSAGIEPGLVHMSATGGILARGPSVAEADAVRPGIGLYGLVPFWAADRRHGLRPALALKAYPLRIFELAAGEAIGYGLRFRTAGPTRIATLGIGYGDGWPRVHANNGVALVHGVRVPIVGAVSMDGITVDVGGVDGVSVDDEFVLIGEQGGDRITAEEVAVQRGTINYEVTTALRARLPRRHLGV